MKLSAVKKRAREDGVDEACLDDADDANDIHAAVIDLIVTKARENSQACVAAPSSTAPHQGDSPGGAGAIEQLASLFGKKHAILSYQWDVQEEVKKARDLLKAAGVPV